LYISIARTLADHALGDISHDKARLTPKHLWDFTTPDTFDTKTLVGFYCPSSKPLLVVIIPPVTLVEARTFLQVGLIGFSAQLAEVRFLLIVQLMKFMHVVAYFMPAFVTL